MRRLVTSFGNIAANSGVTLSVAGSSMGPLLAAFIVLPKGQRSIGWFPLVAILAMALLAWVSVWYKARSTAGSRPQLARGMSAAASGRRVGFAMTILIALLFSKYFYLASLTNYYTFFLIRKFDISVENAQLHLFAFLAAAAMGTLTGGPVGDRIGRKYVIWGSILGVLRFTLMLPYANLFWTGVLSVPVGLILASAFSAILVTRRIWRLAASERSLAYSSGWRSASVESAQSFWANWPIGPASTWCASNRTFSKGCLTAQEPGVARKPK